MLIIIINNKTNLSSCNWIAVYMYTYTNTRHIGIISYMSTHI